MSIGTCMTAVFALLFATGLGANGQEIDRKIDIRDQGYIPATLEVSVGQRVMWANMTQKEQSVVSANKASGQHPEPNKDETPLYDSGPIPIDRYFERTFDKPGTFEYFSRNDPAMRGTVIVKLPE